MCDNHNNYTLPQLSGISVTTLPVSCCLHITYILLYLFYLLMNFYRFVFKKYREIIIFAGKYNIRENKSELN